MKILLTYFLFINCFFNCLAQIENKEEIINNSSIESENYKFSMKRSDIEDAHLIYFNRAIDSLNVKMKIAPSLDKIFKNVSDLEKNKFVFMSISLGENRVYKIEQMNFVQADGRNTSLHKYSADIFNIDLDNYKIEMIECENCTERISFILFNDSKN